MKKKPNDDVTLVNISEIDQPQDALRLDIDEAYISELALSIREVGLLQPILLAKSGDRYEVVFGHCRFLAHIKAGIPRIRATVKVMTPTEVAISRATENLTRKDLTPVEEAKTYNDLIVKGNMTLEQVGKKMGKTPGLIKRRIDILRMAPVLQEALHNKRISIGVAEELWPISDQTQLEYYLSYALDGGCTVTIARQWCKDWKDQIRRGSSDVDGGGESISPYEPRPTYMTCELCKGPVELGQDKVVRTCLSCYKRLIDAIKGAPE